MRTWIASCICIVVLTTACSSGAQDAPTSTASPVEAMSSTGVETTTTTAPDTTTTTASDTTTTTEAVTTTTQPDTTPTTQATATVELSDEGILAGDAWIPFGSDGDDTIAAISTVLGAPTEDSGWVDAFSVYGTCPLPVVRGVHWDSLVLLFTQAETDFWTEGVPHFFAYYLTDIPPDLATTEGLMLGHTVADLEAIYGGPDLEIGEDPFDPSGAFWSYQLRGWTGLSGYASSQGAGGVILSMNGGRGCGE